MTEKPYTDADIELVASATYEDAESGTPAGWYTPWAKAEPWVREEYERCARAVLAALAAAGRLAPPDDNPFHIIQFRTDGWTIKHPLACRLGDLFGCRVNRAAEGVDGPPVPPGRYEVTVSDIDGRIQIGDRVDQAEG